MFGSRVSFECGAHKGSNIRFEPGDVYGDRGPNNHPSPLSNKKSGEPVLPEEKLQFLDFRGWKSRSSWIAANWISEKLVISGFTQLGSMEISGFPVLGSMEKMQSLSYLNLSPNLKISLFLFTDDIHKVYAKLVKDNGVNMKYTFL